MTPEQSSVFQFISRYIKEEGIAPSIHEVKDGTGLSYNMSRFALMDLERLGFVRRKWNRPRAIAILKWPDEAKTAA